MKAKFRECVVEHQRQAFRHIILPFESGERVEPEICTLKDSHDRLARINDSCQTFVGLAPDQKADRTSTVNAFQVGLVMFMAPWRKNPGAMQVLATLRGFEDLRLASCSRLRQKYPPIRMRVAEVGVRVLFTHASQFGAGKFSYAVMRDMADQRLGHDTDSGFVGSRYQRLFVQQQTPPSIEGQAARASLLHGFDRLQPHNWHVEAHVLV